MITAPLVVLGQILGVAFGAGLNLYATVAFLGLAIRLGWIAGLTPALYGLANPIVLATAAFFYVLEFFIDKIPYADTAWDAIHTIIRPVAGAFRIPHTAWPVARNTPGAPGTGPISGMPSSVTGR